MTLQQETSGCPPQEPWEDFSRRHQGHPFLELDPLYSLTEPIIDAVKAEVRAFFAKDQEDFERDLARTAGVGFHLRRPIGGQRVQATDPAALQEARRQLAVQDLPRLVERLRKTQGLTVGDFLREVGRPATDAVRQPTDKAREGWSPFLLPEWTKDQRVVEALAVIQEWVGEVYRLRGDREADIDEVFRQDAKETELIQSRQEAFAGWLVCNRQYRTELRLLRNAWESVVREHGGFPVVPRRPGTDEGRPTPVVPDRFFEAWAGFLRRWCLDTLLTWDLPAPVHTRFGSAEPDEIKYLAEAGVVLFLPWYLLRERQLNLQQIAQRIRFEAAPEHLRGWLLRGPQGDEEVLGDLGFQRLLWLYRYHELVLSRRYQSQCEDNLERLDRALGRAMGNRDGELVRKLRQRLRRELQDP